MAATAVIGCGGLATDANAAVPPPGGMRRADNVVIDAPGVASARPNFDVPVSKDISSPSDERVPHSLTHYGGRTVMVSRGVGADVGDWFFEADTGPPSSSDVEPPELALSHTQFTQARRNLYFTTYSGIRKVTDPLGFVNPVENYAPGQLTLALIAGDWLPSTNLVAYRAVIFRIDANGLETRSAPSGWTYILNTVSGPPNAEAVSVTVPLPAYVAPGDRVEIYRSQVVASGTPSDTLYLSQSHELEPADVSAGVVVINDLTPTEMLGQMLYTSSGREGIEGANHAPPRSIALTTWNDSVWCGSTLYPASLAIDLVRPWHAPSASLTGSIGSGSPVWTVSGAATDVRPGQIVIGGGGGGFPNGTRVLSVVGSVVTMNATAASTQPAIAVELADVFEIDGIEFYGKANTPADYVDREFVVVNAPSNPPAEALRTARNFADMITRGSSGALTAYVLEEVGTGSFSETTYPRVGRIVIQRTTPGGGPLEFDADAATVDAFDPVESFSAEPEDRPNRIAFSKPQEPEHFRALDWIELGREDAHVLAFAPLSGALLVFKQDGVWAVSGTWPIFSAFQVSDAAIVRGRCVDVFEDVAYAWTTRGVLALTERGVAQSLTDGAIRDEFLAWAGPTLESIVTTSEGGAWLTCWDSHPLVLVGASDTPGARAWAYHPMTGAWSTWSLEMRSPIHAEQSENKRARLIYGFASDDVWQLRESADVVRGYDHTLILDLSFGWSEDEDFVQFDEALPLAANWTPRRGDWLRRTVGVTTEHRRVIAASLSGSEWTITFDAPFLTPGPPDSVDVLESALATLEWQRHGMTPPTQGGFIREIQAHLDVSAYDPATAIVDTMRVECGASSDQPASLVTLAATPAQRDVYSRPVRAGLPRAHARSTHLYPYLEVNEAFRWRCLGIGLVGEAQSTRVAR